MTKPRKVMATVFSDMHRTILVDFTHNVATTNAGHFQGALTVLEECVGCQNEYCCCIILPNHMLFTPLWYSWVLNAGIFFLVLPVVLNCYCQTSTSFPKERSIFEAYFSKLMKTSKWRSSSGCICRMLHFTTKALTLWSATLMCVSTDMAAVVQK